LANDSRLLDRGLGSCRARNVVEHGRHADHGVVDGWHRSLDRLVGADVIRDQVDSILGLPDAQLNVGIITPDAHQLRACVARPAASRYQLDITIATGCPAVSPIEFSDSIGCRNTQRGRGVAQLCLEPLGVIQNPVGESARLFERETLNPFIDKLVPGCGLMRGRRQS
jgi:hypothetical protein